MEYTFSLPLQKADVKKLHVGDILYVSGTVFTARDEAHHKMLHLPKKDIPFDPSQMALYHCGPLMKQENRDWHAISAGPTTSSRMEMFEDDFLHMFGTSLIIGKGGMGDRTHTALQQCSAVYAAFPGGAGALAADAIKKVETVYWLEELGMPEAVWVFHVKDFGPLVIAMDAYGESLYKKKKASHPS